MARTVPTQTGGVCLGTRGLATPSTPGLGTSHPPATAGSGVGSVSVEVVAQNLRARGVTQLRHRLGLDLADPLAGHAVDLADLVECLGLAVGQAEAHADHACLTLGQG